VRPKALRRGKARHASGALRSPRGSGKGGVERLPPEVALAVTVTNACGELPSAHVVEQLCDAMLQVQD